MTQRLSDMLDIPKSRDPMLEEIYVLQFAEVTKRAIQGLN